jgi:hypothetical protein
MKVDSTRDLATQIMDLGQTLKKMQKENDGLTNQIVSLRNNIESQQAANARLTGDNEMMKSENRKLQNTIGTLTSNKDSLANQYLQLKDEKEKLNDFSKSIAAIRTRVEEDKTEGGYHSGKANIYVQNVLLGSLTWRIPLYLNHNQSKSGEAVFSAESIDYVRINPEERLLLRSLGEKLKVHIDLASDSTTMVAAPEPAELMHQVGERDKSTWKWNIKNKGTKDGRLFISVRLINKDSHEIPVFQRESNIAASNAVRQVRNYLQPIPLVAGIILGFLLFGIVGIFRRPSKAKSASRPPQSSGTSEPPHITQKQL